MKRSTIDFDYFQNTPVYEVVEKTNSFVIIKNNFIIYYYDKVQGKAYNLVYDHSAEYVESIRQKLVDEGYDTSLIKETDDRIKTADLYN